MPSATKALLQTSSYHIKTVVKCNMSKKASASVKLIVRREGGNKRYDFEAENAQLAGEINFHFVLFSEIYGMLNSGDMYLFPP